MSKSNPGHFQPGHELSLKHGGAAAAQALSAGEPLHGLASVLKEKVHEEIEQRGVLAVMRERAERHQAVADLYYGLCLGSTEVEPLDSFVKRFGWLNAKAFKMLKEVAEMEKEQRTGQFELGEILMGQTGINDND